MQSILFAAALMSAAVNGFVFPRDTKTSICGSTSSTQYTVANGDTLTSIAEKFKSGICDIASVNKLQSVNVIKVGQVLTVPKDCKKPDNTSCLKKAGDATETCVPGLPATYTVVSGDTLTTIAKDFNITLNSLTAANTQIGDPNAINVGQVINVPVCPNSQCKTVGTYKIKSGDVFVDLATKYHTRVGQIKALNNNVDPTKLAVGQQIILPQNCKNVTTAAA